MVLQWLNQLECCLSGLFDWICLESLPDLSVSGKRDIWQKVRVSEFTFIESIDKSIDRSVGGGRSAAVGQSHSALHLDPTVPELLRSARQCLNC